MRFHENLGCAGTYIAAMLALAVPVNLALYAATAGVEKIQRSLNGEYGAKQVITATLQWQDTALMAQTKGRIDHAMFSVKGGKGVHVIDGMSVLEGKILCNTILHDMERGKRYEITVQGGNNVGYTLLNAKEVTR
jgi:hypothetical protein